jgi:alpha-mannosidase
MEILSTASYDTIEIDALVTVPPCGYATIYVRDAKPAPLRGTLSGSSRRLENDFLTVEVNDNGTLTMTDKSTRNKYKNLLMFEDTEDAGDEYTYSWAERSKTFTTKRSKPKITVVERSSLRTTIAILHRMSLPASLNATRSGRSRETVDVTIESRVTLCTASRRIDVTTAIHNTAHDHRLRVLFPTDIVSSSSVAGGHFDIIERPHVTERPPTLNNKFEYYTTRHHQDFVSIHDEKKGLAIADKGIPEYEAIAGKSGTTIALTLLRCVGQLSRNDFPTRHMLAGPQLPTPEAQCPGMHTFEYSIIPFAKDDGDESTYIESLNFGSPIHHCNVQRSGGHLPAAMSIVTIEPKELVLSALKRSEDKSGVIVRFCNLSAKEVSGNISTYRPLQRCDIVNLNEELLESAPLVTPRSLTVKVPAKKIMTLKLTFS